MAAVAATPASAVVTKLRVEAEGHDLDRGNSYVHADVSYQTTQTPVCPGSGATRSIEAATPLGLLVEASDFNRRLDPVAISDQYDFGPFVCGIGGFGPDGYWLYKVDHVDPQIAADQRILSEEDSEVLWYFVNPTTGTNSGSELGLFTGDQYVQVGKPAEVRVLQFDVEGNATPAPGARLMGAGDAITDARGDATVVFDTPGRPVVRGVRGNDIPTDAVRFCVYELVVDECSDLELERVIGTDRADTIATGTIPALVLGRRGNDVIRSRGGGHDEVRCGKGRDRVTADKIDVVRRDCERVSRK